MNKEVIYVDVENDITDLIGKVKDSKEKIIAIVPPKGIGVLRSAVNLRLIQRAAEQNDKRVVLISNDDSLKAIAAGAKIPVAKTLQSKPEIPEIDALEVDGEDIIDGEKMAVGDFAKKKTKDDDVNLDNIDIDDNKSFTKKAPKKAKKKGAGGKIPDFNKFRKRIFIIGGAAVLLIGVLVWALVFAPAATIIIKAKTSVANVQETVDLTTNKELADISKGVLFADTQTVAKPSELSFDATGTKDIGEKASGTLTLSQSSESDGVSVKAGTGFSSGDCTFTTTKNVVIPGVKFAGGKPTGVGSVDVDVQATAVGEQCNLSARTYLSPISEVSASGTAMSGGMKKTVKIVTEADVQNAKQKLVDAKQTDVKAELAAKFNSDDKIIDESFLADHKDPTVSPSVGSESSNGKATIKAQTIYTLSAIRNSDLSKFLDKTIESKLDDKNSQKIYKNGAEEAKLSDFSSNNGATKIKITTSGKTGPKIDEAKIKDQSQGKRYGEVQSQIEEIDGVNSVDVKFSFFWVTSVPKNNDRITVKYDVEG